MNKIAFYTFSTLISIGVAISASAEEKQYSELDGFSKTTLKAECIAKERIKRTRVLDNETILFKMTNGDYVLNKLSEKCNVMGVSGHLVNEKSAYCSDDEFLTGHGPALGNKVAPGGGNVKSCNLGHFEIYRRTSS
ncbi:hypothetical protein [Pseudemcibacter aquimaris]|uniref:hypothetical protein n=1 Tax=Pseudemcibacter aquimaris TaxID=2857064 RepID=UPI00201138A7|nr:hypothetical protein [Pseudemcibacter aquimaris]MCC3860481.1 hypothetical protein [Pseudemcibacter aquimaris]WDU59306.1 hypothetical protein KW060_03390 [Pseudemcibacter aquimaris]